MKPDTIKKGVLVSIAAIFILGAAAASTRAQTVWLACHWDTSAVWKDKDGRQKFERRFYISELVSMPVKDYLKTDSTGDRIEGLCGDCLDKTVNKAATARGERLDPSGQLKILRNIELSGENIGSPNPYKFAPKENVAKLLAADINEMKDAGRIIYTFNWDPTGKNEQADADNELKRTSPTIGPTPSKPNQ
ncbi:MAG TPA: hypothetical protein DC054_17425 [Blastocatellia bacterium]|nr:hypothetical protein [Blastocatellia bacterium]